MELEQQISYRNIIKVSVPIMVGGLSNTIVNLTDTAFLARVGETELGGAGNAGLLFFLLIIIGMGFATGTQILLARRNGERNYEAIGSLVQHSASFLLLYGVLVVTFIWLGLQSLLPLVVDSQPVAEVVLDFMEVRSWGVFFNYFNLIFLIFYVGTTKTKIIGVVTPVIAGLNIVLDYLLIFGEFGFPQLGVRGAALASNISEVVGCFILLLYTFQVHKNSEYALFKVHEIKWDRFRRIFKVSSPLMVQNFLAMGAWFAFFTIIEHLGESELAASHIVRSMYMVLIIPVFALGDTSNALTGNLFGQDKVNMVIPMLKNILVVAMATVALLQPVYYLLGDILFSPFTSDADLIALADPVLQIIFTVLFLFAVVIMGFRVISGAGKTFIALVVESCAVAVYLCSAWWVSTIEGVALWQVWMVEFVYFIVFATLVYGYIWKGNWRESKI